MSKEFGPEDFQYVADLRAAGATDAELLAKAAADSLADLGNLDGFDLLADLLREAGPS